MRRSLLALVLAGFCGSAWAGATTTITLASDYLFDGVSQTQGSSRSDFNPAFQISFDYATESGFFLGTWASNVDFGEGDPAHAEQDFYGGYSTSYESGWGWNVGVFHYTYHGAPSSYDYTEFNAGVTFPTGTTANIWVADDDVLGGQAYRVKGKHAFDLGNDFSLNLEATYTNYDNSGFDDYAHGQIGVSHPWGPFTAYLGYSDTDRDALNADGRLLFTLATTIELF